ncbi:fibroblast growth factor receptor-like 1 isoform X2 [Tigriopus californicus]|uniref:fibroblast growth factor receptor-like 1 isoform X2 n=1 Tax=Tigriopus californicus TaxID=6832 RepID=UPI0027DA32B4|nr:fibroblast growth factor receptor-like 1 isoform X2 [Tigriopus californicus]
MAKELRSSSSIWGPPLADPKEVQNVVRLGEDTKIVCPISGYPRLIISWSKGNDDVMEYSWTRFRRNKKSLKIKDVELGDAGTYVCKGTNGFGSDEAKIKLIVIDPADFPSLDKGELPDVSLPSFTEDTLSRASSYIFETNDRIHIPCRANGKPEPKVQWLRYRTEFQGPEPLNHHSGMASLNINNAKQSHEGIYGCIARNRFGEVARNFTIEVEEPDLVLSNGFKNYTVEEGEPAALECKVEGSSSFKLSWLKKYRGPEVRSDIIDVGDQKFIRIQNHSKSTLNSGNNEYINTLLIPNAHESDAGMYVCVTESQTGFGFKNYLLSVTKLRPTDSVEIAPLLIAVICVSVVAFFILMLILIRVFRNRPKKPLVSETPDVQENLMRQQQQRRQQQQQQQQQEHQQEQKSQQQQPQQQPQQRQPIHMQQQTQAQHLLHLTQAPRDLRAIPNQYHIKQTQQQYQANVNNNRNMNIHLNKLDQPLPPPPPPPSLHNEGSSSSNNPQWAIYPPTNSLLNYTDSSVYNGSSLYGGNGGGPPQNEYEVPHVNSMMGMRNKNQALGAPASLHSGGYGNNPKSAHQPIYPYRSQQYGFYDD